MPLLISFTAHWAGTNRVINHSDMSVTALRYGVWGESRSQATNSVPTDRLYTGQEKSSYINLYWYDSRWFDPALGRFLQPDSIIPDIYNPLDLDPYSYVNNNPVNYNDPTGHAQACADGDEGGGCGSNGTIPYIINKYISMKTSGTTVPWNDLNSAERSALENNQWNEYVWQDTIGGPGVTAADPLHDPLVWFVSLFGAGRFSRAGINFLKAAAPIGTICVTGGRCGDVFSRISATQPNWPGTQIPKSFTINIGNSTFWVHPNATEHMMELATRNPANVLNPAASTTMAQKMVLESFESAVSTAVSQGIQYGQINQIGNWQLIFGPPSQPGLFPAIIHAFFQ